MVHFCLTFNQIKQTCIWIRLHTFVMPNCLVLLHHCERIQREFFKMALGCRACLSTAEVGGGTHAQLWMTHFVLCTKKFCHSMCMQMIHRHHHSLFPLLSTFFIYSLPGHGPHQHALHAPHGRLWCLLHCPAHPAANLRCLLEVPAPLLFFSLPRSTLAYATSRAPAITLKCNFRVSFATARTTMSYKCFKCSRRRGFWCAGGVMIRFLLVHATDGEIMLITLWSYEKMEFLFSFFFPHRLHQPVNNAYLARLPLFPSPP